MSGKKKSVSLVLGAGGARGLAHIGVIEELVARKFRIRAIAGCSMGALVGGIYALGKLPAYRDWVTGLGQTDILGLLDWSMSKGGLIQGDRLIGKLRQLVGERNIEELPLDFTAVAVDIQREQEVWISEGSLFDAIRASIAIPAVFTPHHYRGRTLVDGGLLNPVPVAPTRRNFTDLTIVVDVNARSRSRSPTAGGGARFPPGLIHRVRGALGNVTGSRRDDSRMAGMAMWDVLTRSLDTMQAALTRQHLAVYQPDLVVSIPRNLCMAHEFYRAGEVIEVGRQTARQVLDDWRRQ